MTTICTCLDSILGNEKTVAPVNGSWVETTPKQFEELVRNLAYGFMVKDYRKGEVLSFMDCTDDMKTFIRTACLLSHLDAKFDKSDDCNAVIPASDIDYLMTIGSTWSRKYKAAVDRSIARLVLG